MDSSLATAFQGDHHLIVSFDPIAPATSRWSAVIGVQPSTNATCTTAGYHMSDPQPGTPYDCL
jgi:hypothetical protein